MRQTKQIRAEVKAISLSVLNMMDTQKEKDAIFLEMIEVERKYSDGLTDIIREVIKICGSLIVKQESEIDELRKRLEALESTK